MKEISRLLVALTLIAACSGLILSLVEGVTREPIKEQRRIQMLKALSAVLPEFDNSPDTRHRHLAERSGQKGAIRSTPSFTGLAKTASWSGPPSR